MFPFDDVIMKVSLPTMALVEYTLTYISMNMISWLKPKFDDDTVEVVWCMIYNLYLWFFSAYF